MAEKKEKAIKKAVGWILFISTVFVLSSFIIIQTAFADKAINIIGFRFYLVANTKSMEPELKTNSLILVKKYDFNKLTKGDYVTFNCQVTDENKNTRTIVITHKIIEVITDNQTRCYRTQGTNPSVKADAKLLTIDGSNNTNKYIGKYVTNNLALGHMVSYFGSLSGIFAVATNTLCIITILYLLKKDKDDPKLLLNRTGKASDPTSLDSLFKPSKNKQITKLVEYEDNGFMKTVYEVKEELTTKEEPKEKTIDKEEVTNEKE